MRGKSPWWGLLAISAVFAVPATALGADTYVDAEAGSDGNPCTLAQPCETIQAGIDAATTAASVHVDPGSYPLGLQIGDGIGLLADPFAGGAGVPVIDGGSDPAIEVDASGAGTVDGFSISSSANPVIDLEGPIDLRNNSIEVLGSNARGILVTAGVAGLVTIADNELLGDSTSGQTAIHVRNGSEASITENRVGSPGQAFNGGIFATEGATAEIAGNTLRAFFSVGSAAGQPILVQDASATITGNVVRNTQPAPDFVSGIVLVDSATAPGTAAALHRNELYGGGLGYGINIIGRIPATIEGDLVTGFDRGIFAIDPSFTLPRPVVDASGVTAFGSHTHDIRLEGFDLTLDSSIVGLPVALSGPGLECTITYSRGLPNAAFPGHSCNDFQTSAPPAFVDESPMFGEPDLHLTAGSPMIDAGNPAAPPGDALDIDGDPRALDGDEDCPEERTRDIGADEFGALLDCDPPETRIKGKKKTTKERAKFKLRSDEPNSTFRCKLDKRRWRNCKPRYKTPKLDLGKHKLKAKATDAAGNEDPSAAVKRFKAIAG